MRCRFITDQRVCGTSLLHNEHMYKTHVIAVQQINTSMWSDNEDSNKADTAVFCSIYCSLLVRLCAGNEFESSGNRYPRGIC